MEQIRFLWNTWQVCVIDKVENRTSILKRLAGVKWRRSQIILNKTYNVYIKPIFKYRIKASVSTTQGKIDSLERTQNKVLQIITGAVKTTFTTAMQSCTSDQPIANEIKKQAVGIFLKIKVLHKV